VIKGERSMSPQATPRRTLEDIERLERVPLAQRLAVGSTYELLQKTVASSPERAAHGFLPFGNPSQPGEALTARAFLGKVHQSANLLADLGMGPQDVMALLLPDLLEKELLLWGGQAAGIVCPIPPCLPAPQIVELLQAARAKVLVTLSPEVDHECGRRQSRCAGR
jgi:fatty-acyl-CoA synthase